MRLYLLELVAFGILAAFSGQKPVIEAVAQLSVSSQSNNGTITQAEPRAYN